MIINNLRNKIFCNRKMYLIFFLTIYFFLSMLFLTKFPYMHSDESWLSGLSRNMVESKSYSVTEPFYDLKVRHPHAIKIIFHTIQIFFIKIIGYHLFGMRLISLLFAVLSLFYIYKLCYLLLQSEKFAFLCMLLLSLDVQFIYASHFARQEIILLFLLVFNIHYIMEHIDEHTMFHDIIAGSIIGLSIGIHPNSFIIFLPFLLIYLYYAFFSKKIKIVNMLLFVITVGLYALFFVLISIYFDPEFIKHYFTYGHEEFEVLNPIGSKIKQFKYFFLKLFYQVSGTYYTPNIKLQFVLFLTVFLYSLFHIVVNRRKHTVRDHFITIQLSIIGIIIGIILIGRYNQTSIIFIFPLFYLLVTYVLYNFKKRYQSWIIFILIILLTASSTINILPYINNSYYEDYLRQISQAVEKDRVVLGNLNTEYYFDNGKLFDYRNLAFLKNNQMTFKEYIRKNKIQYIIYPEEMDYIYKTRPQWYGLYGNLVYYEEMQDFFENHCERIHEFENNTYGIRISRFVNKGNWKITIYKVIENE